MMVLRRQLEDGLGAIGLTLDDVQIDALMVYVQLLQKWNAKINLTRIVAPEHMVTHHLLDCLTVLPALGAMLGDKPQQVLDVGSGAGLPGLVWAVAKPDWSFCLIDTVQKKTAFMQQAWAEMSTVLGSRASAGGHTKPSVVNTEISVQSNLASTGLCVVPRLAIMHGRVESSRLIERPTLITSRAFSDVKQFLQLTRHLANAQTTWAALKGQLGKDCEIPEGFECVSHRLVVPGVNEIRHVLLVRHQQTKPEPQ